MLLLLSGKKKNRDEFYRQYNLFTGSVGDIVVFKGAKNAHRRYKITDIEGRYNQLKWSKNDKLPNFVQLQRITNDSRGETLWTNPINFDIVERYPNS